MSTERIIVPADQELMAEWAAHLLPTSEANGLTSYELAKLTGLAQSTIRTKMRVGVLSGTYKCGWATRTASTGRPVKVPVYWLAEKPKPSKPKKRKP